MPQIATIRGRRILNHFYFSLDHNMRLRMSDDRFNLNIHYSVNAVVTFNLRTKRYNYSINKTLKAVIRIPTGKLINYLLK